MIQVLIVLHTLVGAALLGAVTHQAFVVARHPTAPGQTFVQRYLGVSSPTFTNTVVLLFFTATVLGALLYPRYRVDVRPTLEDLQLRAANGIFEIKEHFAAIGLGLLPAYWLAWRRPLSRDGFTARKYFTWMLAFIVWWNFIVGELLNNIKGMFP